MTRRTTWIAKVPVVYVYPDGRREKGRVAVGKPYRHARGFAACPIEGRVKLARTVEIFGEDELQALLLAVQFLAFELHAFRTIGGRVLDPVDGHAIGLEHYFGPMLREPEPGPLPKPKTKRAPRDRRGARSPR